MAGALIGGLVAKGADARSISVIEVSPSARERLAARYPVRITTAPDAAMQGADTLVLAVKPQDMRSSLASLATSGPGKLVISIAAGATLDPRSPSLQTHHQLRPTLPTPPPPTTPG